MSYNTAKPIDPAVPFSLREVPRLVIPAVAALALTGVISAAAMTRRLHPGPAYFEKQADAALAAQKPKEAALWLRRQLEEAPAARESRMKLMEVYFSLNQIQPAVDLLNQLAPGDDVVYGPAHLRRAQLIMATAPTGGGGRAAAEAKICLQLAMKADPTKGQGEVDINVAKALLAEVLAAEGDWLNVLATAESITAPTSSTQLLRAQAMKNLGRQEEAQEAAGKVAAQVAAAEDAASPEASLSRASALAQASLVQGDLEKAIEIARAAGTAPPCKALQAAIYRQAAVACRTAKEPDPVRWLEIVAGGLSNEPEHLDLTVELLQGLATWDREAGLRERVLARLEGSGLLAHVQLMAGLASLGQRRQQLALTEFKKAWELLPANPIIANNYAGALALQRDPSIAGAALPIIDAVLKNYPGAPTFLDTKGQVLLAMGQAKDAVFALEAALKGAPSAAAHLILAEAYARMGSPVLAQSHRQRAAAFQQQASLPPSGKVELAPAAAVPKPAAATPAAATPAAVPAPKAAPLPAAAAPQPAASKK